jgi:hypothetical protein
VKRRFGNKSMVRRTAVIALLILALTGTSAVGEDMDIPVSQQFTIFMKIVDCNREFASHADSVLTFAILYQSNNKQSLTTRDELMNIIAKSPKFTVGKYPVKFIDIDLDRLGDIAGEFAARKVDIAYITPLRAVKIEDLSAACNKQSVLTFTGITSYLEEGLAVSIANRGGKPQIVINLPAAKAEKVNFSSQILKLARIME